MSNDISVRLVKAGRCHSGRASTERRWSNNL